MKEFPEPPYRTAPGYTWEVAADTRRVFVYKEGKLVMVLSGNEIFAAIQKYEAEKELESAEQCPDCLDGKLLCQPGGGVACNRCSYWFCY